MGFSLPPAWALTPNSYEVADKCTATRPGKERRKIREGPQDMASPVPLPAWFHPLPLTEPQQLGVTENDMNYGERLFHYTYGTRHHEHVHYLEYRMLHRLNIFHLQNRLAELKGKSWAHHDLSDAGLLDLKDRLHDYSKYPCRL